MRTLASIPIILLAVVTIAWGQEEDGTWIRLGTGFDQQQVNDRLVSPVRSDGFVTAFDLGAEFRAGTSTHEIALDCSLGEISNRYGLPAFGAGIHFGYDHRRRVTEGGDGRWSLDLGGRLSWNSRIHFYYLLDEAHLYWLTATELGPSAVSRWRSGRTGMFALRFGFPLVAFVSRSPEQRYYNNDQPNPGDVLDLIHTDLSFAGPPDYLGFDLGAEYSFDLSDRLNESIRYRGSYRRSGSPMVGEFLAHSFLIVLRYRL